MTSQKKHRLAFFFLIFTAGYGGYIAYDITIPTKPVTEEIPLIITGLKVTNYDKKGLALKKFDTQKLIHFERAKTSQLINPVINVTHNNNAWHITSRFGQTYAGNEKVKLYGDVKITQHAEDGTVQHMETELLWYFPKKHLAITDKIIHYKRGGEIAITSKGMRANLDNKHVELLQQVKATYSQNNHHENT